MKVSFILGIILLVVFPLRSSMADAGNGKHISTSRIVFFVH